MSLATSSPAWNLSTDSHQIIRPLPPRSHTEETRTGSLYRRFYIVGTAGITLSGFALVVYPLAAFGYAVHRVVLNLLMVAMLAGAIVGTGALMTILAVKTVDRLCARRLAAMRAELGYDLAATAGRYAKLVELPESVRTQVDRQGKAFGAIVTGLQHDLGQRLGEVERDRAELQNLLRQQVATNRDLLVQVERLAKEHTGFARLVLDHLQRIEPGVGQAERVNGEQPAEEVGGELVPMPNSRAFKLGREVERRRWERHNGDS